jgi:hypothetical protein
MTRPRPKSSAPSAPCRFNAGHGSAGARHATTSISEAEQVLRSGFVRDSDDVTGLGASSSGNRHNERAWMAGDSIRSMDVRERELRVAVVIR